MDKVKAEELFQRWFVIPISILKEMPNGDGGFVAFISALALYERLIVAKLKIQNQTSEPEKVKQAMAKDLGLSPREQTIFWDMFRNGLLHRAMPKAGKTSWIFHNTFGASPTFKFLDHAAFVCIDPWKFTDRVLKEFLDDPNLIIASESFPLPSILLVPFDQLK